MTCLSFPDHFLWGVATSAQQIEGAAREDNRGESIWDRYASIVGNIEDGSDPSVACDHYHRWREDIRLLQDLGVGAYRFSVAWPRVFPLGRGSINQPGLDFYDALVDGLLGAGIKPFVTLYHWDLPQTLQDEGGWGARGTAEAFAEYAEVVTRCLGDRVQMWATHNEPWCTSVLGYEQGDHAPGLRDPAQGLRAAHHVLLSHGWAMERIRKHVPNAEAGIVLNLTPAHPATESPADQDAARWFDGFFNRMYLDPLFRGEYPQDVILDRAQRGHLAEASLPFVQPGDLKAISVPMDFLGVNYYSRVIMSANEKGEPKAISRVPKEALTDMGWEVYPQGMHDLLVRVHAEYQPKTMIITENGAAFGEGQSPQEQIADARRITFMHDHLAAAQRAIEDGVPLRGYFAWSLMDNFEWGQGYNKRFGLYRVDYQTQERVPKHSMHWYRDLIAAHAAKANVLSTEPRSV